MLASTVNSSDVWEIALAVFLLAVGFALAYLFVRMARTTDSVTDLIKGTEREVLPVIEKVGGSVDTAVRAVSMAITKPVQKVSGFATGVSYGAADLKTKRGWKHAVQAGKEAAARREQELADELKDAGKEQ